jgi:hypothetical protein
MTKNPNDKTGKATFADLQSQIKARMGRFEELRGFL